MKSSVKRSRQARRQEHAIGPRGNRGVTWRILGVSRTELERLQAIAAHVAVRQRLIESWGFGRRHGAATIALFDGPWHAGKRRAARLLARSLGLDLEPIDLKAIASKYIGETEKNLRRVFDAAADSGAVLFFDEADVLFGKRADVRDSHDRYANAEISYLLQRLERYEGLAILATNRTRNIDPAFLRRVAFVVRFPAPRRTRRGAKPAARRRQGSKTARSRRSRATPPRG